MIQQAVDIRPLKIANGYDVLRSLSSRLAYAE
jgi:hypothetical protein